MDRLQAMQVFRAVVEAGSFAGGARRLGVSNAMVSKQISRLEESLGVRLLARTTRRLQLTAEGERYLTTTARLLDELDELEAGLGELPRVTVNEAAANRIAHGNPAPVTASEAEFGEDCWASHAGQAIAIGRYMGGEFHPGRVLNR